MPPKATPLFWVACTAATILIVGGAGPWIDTPIGSFRGTSINHGWIAIGSGVIALLLLFGSYAQRDTLLVLPAVLLMAGIFAGALAIYDIANLRHAADQVENTFLEGALGVGWGLVLTAVGAAGLIACGAAMLFSPLFAYGHAELRNEKPAA